MPFLALKPCKFCDKHYLIGDIVPDESVDPGITRVLEDAEVIKYIPARSARQSNDDQTSSDKQEPPKEKPSDGSSEPPKEEVKEPAAEGESEPPKEEGKQAPPRGKKAG